MKSQVPSRQFVLALAGLVSVGALMIGSLFFIRGMTYRATVDWASHLPLLAQQTFAAVSSYGILALIALFLGAALVARQNGATRLARGVAAGIGVVIAYIASEGVKEIVSQLRPCRNFAVTTVTDCPAVSDWAWPSNHAAIAAALAVSILVMAPRLGPLAALVATGIAISRVVVGVHYFHDVVAGFVLAVLVVAIVVRFGSKPMQRGIAIAARRFPIVALALGMGPEGHPRTNFVGHSLNTAATV